MAIFLLATTAVRAEFTVGRNFTGSTFGQSNAFPPDTMGAVGPDHVVEMINGRFAAYEKSTGSLRLAKTLDRFWADAGVTPAGAGAFDPRILYDRFSGRWFAVSVDNQGEANHFLVAVSGASDPTQGWTGFRIASDPNDRAQWADFPTLGINGQGLYVSANMFPVGGTGFHSQTLLVLPKAGLLAAVPTVAGGTLIQNRTEGWFSLQPAVDMDNSSLPLPALATTQNFPSAFVYQTVIEGPVAAPALAEPAYILVDPLSKPPSADQPTIGASAKKKLDTRDDRFSSSVVAQNHSLWAVQAVRSDGRSAVRWFQIDPADHQILQTDLLADQELAYYYPSIAVNDLGDVVIAFSGSSRNQPISSYAVLGQTTDGVTSFASPVLLKAGMDDYQRLDDRGRNRWGDYSTTVLDPCDERTFWTFQEYVSGEDQWSVQITQIILDDPFALPGDLNRDDTVDPEDINQLLRGFGFEQGAAPGNGDMDGDGDVDDSDLNLLLSRFGASERLVGPSHSVPEPKSILLAAVGLLGCLARKRARNNAGCRPTRPPGY